MAVTVEATRLRVGALQELQRKGVIVVTGPYCPIAVFWHDGRVYAVDNRCPHMGFPLHKGPVQDGILTCPWHHARFDLSSGCTFDLWADDAPSFPVEVQDGEVFVLVPPLDNERVRRHWLRRLREGMEHGLDLVVAKAVIHLLRAGADYRALVQVGAELGTRYRNSWASGMTILTAMANLVPLLPTDEALRALFHGLSHVASDIQGQATRRERQPLEGSTATLTQIKRWLRHWTLVRHRDGAERCLLTALANGATPADIADLLFTAATDRPFADGGHLVDFCNKAMELLDLIGWDFAPQVLPTLTTQLVSSRGGEENSAWRYPVDLVALMREAEAQLPEWLRQGRQHRMDGKPTMPVAHLAHALLSDKPQDILSALQEAAVSGIKPTELSKALCYAAALRIARFGESNEFGDWITVLHTFSYCNAVHQTLKRFGDTASAEVVRAVWHGAMAVYLDRFLNIPPEPLPGERSPLSDLPTDAGALRAAILEACDKTGQDLTVAALTAHYLQLRHPVEPLLATLAHCVLREDADFHTFQMLEAGIRQFQEWGTTTEGQHILIATARYIAAHAPTQRANEQTFRIAWRLHRGEALHDAV
ncbi:3-phenylpropionate/cinnamic acid dioxygenase ferredoxin subunit [bacterium HR17]|uniref:3-phenylpropionate/cinnamic acid dioxygenase ferredoxin subunit n=1 Tax=Candidatus Fervidibacter japonicus TaxID=2035412 RepID=A0A2H5X8R2_9BACT|nr:3-phenylpropionate/cinnamic acid dioxygenase ferredoxin subunit [bacterium HR17]